MMGVLGSSIFLALVIGLYFWNRESQQTSRPRNRGPGRTGQTAAPNAISAPALAEKICPTCLMKSSARVRGSLFRAALCGPNPQHDYLRTSGGETAAARLVLEEAAVPFTISAFAKFVEIDATTARFDDRGYKSLMGSVHDPIPGAGPRSRHPQPKPGAVTKAPAAFCSSTRSVNFIPSDE